jgi:lycopene cyclase domain-containing protein
MEFIYLGVVGFSLTGLALADFRYKLVLFWRPRQMALVLTVAVGFFLLWDITGIVLDVFSTNPAWVSGWYVITPNLPVEEFGFLTLLNYQIMLLWRWLCLRTH